MALDRKEFPNLYAFAEFLKREHQDILVPWTDDGQLDGTDLTPEELRMVEERAGNYLRQLGLQQRRDN